MKTIIAGSRTIYDMELLQKAIAECGWEITEVVCGLARGVDMLGLRWAVDNNIEIRNFPAEWEKYGKAAGAIRNKQMAEYAEAAIIIWDGNSVGTLNMLRYAKQYKLLLHYVQGYNIK